MRAYPDLDSDGFKSGYRGKGRRGAERGEALRPRTSGAALEALRRRLPGLLLPEPERLWRGLYAEPWLF